MTEYDNIEGNLKIKDGKIFAFDKELRDNDVLKMPVKMLKKILEDADGVSSIGMPVPQNE